MPTRSGHRRVLAAAVVIALAAPVSAVWQSATPAAAASLTTAWHGGAFSENVGGVVSRSDVVLGQDDMADDFLGGWIDQREAFGAVRLDEGAVDVEVVDVAHGDSWTGFLDRVRKESRRLCLN